MLITAIILVAGYFTFSQIKPYSKYSFRTVFIDSKTHIYNSGEEFSYGPYMFLITYEYKKIDYELENCDATAASLMTGGSGRLFSFEDSYSFWYQECRKSNRRKAQEERLLDVQIKITNNDKVVKSISRQWFQIISSEGKTIKEPDYYLEEGNLIPRETRAGAINTPVKKNTENKLSISIPGLATQIVSLPVK